MSNDDAGQAAAASEIEAFFNRIIAAGYQPRLRSVTGRCRFDIAGAGSWRINVRDGTPTLNRTTGEVAQADCVVAGSADDVLHLMRQEGNLNLYAAWLQGIVTISGDIFIAATLLGSYTLETTGSESR